MLPAATPPDLKALTVFERVFAGGIAGMVAAACVYPLEVVKTLLTA